MGLFKECEKGNLVRHVARKQLRRESANAYPRSKNDAKPRLRTKGASVLCSKALPFKGFHRHWGLRDGCGPRNRPGMPTSNPGNRGFKTHHAAGFGVQRRSDSTGESPSSSGLERTPTQKRNAERTVASPRQPNQTNDIGSNGNRNRTEVIVRV